MRQILLALVAATGLVAFVSGCAMQPANSATQPAERAAAVEAREGAIELQWQAPKDRLNGTPLSPSEIAGYRIYIGDQPGHSQRVISVDNPRQTEQLLRGLKPGDKYYVAISTVDREGQESPKSGEISLVAAPITDQQIAKAERHQASSQRASLD